jgi:Ca-activated chloride channel family protein
MIVSDGDTLPDTGMPELPRSVAKVVVIGVGDPFAGTYIDGHQSRQDAVVLRQLAQRLRGVYHDANERHLPSQEMLALSGAVPLRDIENRGRREAALAAVGSGAGILALLPVPLALAGSPWQAGSNSSRAPIARVGVRRWKGLWIWGDASPNT